MSSLWGYVYIAYNQQFEGLYKVGHSKSPQRRCQQLSQTAMPSPYELIQIYYVTNARKAEKMVHNMLDDYRYHHRREFFQCSIDQIHQACLSVADFINEGRPIEKTPLSDDDIDRLNSKEIF